ncbi:hypothetical protein [Halobacteriovorax sp. DPLXC-1]|uniref:hypothetical protein n=1 Tax=Halobacteriovorax sp. DPLXC-1 TaxID=3110771 RepID=UPI002FEFB98C
MKKLLALSLFFGAFTANAAYVSFDFDVYSSGSSIYPCNAGIKHQGYSDRVCYNRETLDACTPPSGSQQESCQEDPTGPGCDCVCTGGFQDDNHQGDGEWLMDTLEATSYAWSENGDAIDPQTQQVHSKSANQSGKVLFNDASRFNRQLGSLVFNLGSERYGTEYFLDICYRATQIDYTGSAQPNHALQRRVTISDLRPDGDSTPDNTDWDFNDDIVYAPGASGTYQNLAGLEVKIETLCRIKGVNGNPDTQFTESTSWMSLAAMQVAEHFTNHSPSDLRGCVFRYKFREGNRTGIDSIRKWRMHAARICTETAVNEADVTE